LREQFLFISVAVLTPLAKLSAVYSHKLVTQLNFAVLTEHTDAADVDFN